MHLLNTRNNYQASPHFSSGMQEKRSKEGNTELPNALEILDKSVSSSTAEQSLENRKITPKKEDTNGNWFYRIMPNFLIRIAIKAGEKIFVNTKQLNEERQDNLNQLEYLTQSTELPSFLGAISPLITTAIQENASDDERLKGLLAGEKRFLTDCVDALLIKIVVNIIKHTKVQGPVFLAPIISFFVQIVDKHFDTIHSSIAQIEQEKDPIERKKALQNLFAPMVDELLAVALPNGEKDIPLISAVRGHAWIYLKDTLLPNLLHNLYHSFMDPQADSKIEQLRQLKGGNLLANLCDGAGSKAHELGPRIVIGISEAVAETVTAQFPKADELSTELQSDLRKQAQDRGTFTQEDFDDDWSRAVVDLNSWLENELVQLGKCQDPSIQNLWKFIGNAVKPILAQVLFKLAKGSEEADPIQAIFSKLMAMLGKYIQEKGPQISEAYRELQRNGIEPSDDKAFIALFQPLSSEIFGIIGVYEQDSPVPRLFGKDFWKNCEEKYLSQFLAKTYTKGSFWQSNMEEYRAEIREITQTNYIPDSCRVLAQWINDFLGSHIAVRSSELGHAIYDYAKRNLNGGDVDIFLREHEEEIKNLFTQDILKLAEGITQENPITATTKHYTEALLLKVFSNLTNHIHSLEHIDGLNYQEDFLSKAALSLLNIVNQHFCKMNEIRLRRGKSTVNSIDSETMLNEFGDQLHPAIPKELANERKRIQQAQKIIDIERKKISNTKNPARIEVSRQKIKEAQKVYNSAKEKIDEHRLQNYFIPLINKFLKIINLDNSEKIPMSPSMWDILRNQILPKLALEVFDEISKPQRRNQFLLLALEAVEEAINTAPDKNIEEAEIIYKDDTQTDLDKACGELVLQIFQMIPIRLLPEAMVRVLFKLAKVKDISGEKIGRILRTKLKNEWSTIKILDIGLAEGMKNLYPGQWNNEPKSAQYIPKNTGHKDDNRIDEPGKLESDLPMSEDEREILEQRRWEKDQATARVARKKLGQVPYKAISLSLKDFVVGPWHRFNKKLNRVIHNHLGMTSLIVKQFCDYICHKLFFTFLGGMLAIVTYPVRKAVSFIIEFYLRHKLRHLYNTMHMDIHDNLYYEVGQGFIDVLKWHEQDPLKELITHLLETAYLRSQKVTS